MNILNSKKSVLFASLLFGAGTVTIEAAKKKTENQPGSNIRHILADELAYDDLTFGF